MSNNNGPYGLRPINQFGTMWSGQAMMCNVPATVAVSLCLGDAVVALGGSDAFGCPAVNLAGVGAGNPILGSVISICNGPSGSNVTVTRDQPPYRLGSTSNYILVAADDELLFTIQEDSVGGAITQALGANANANLSNISQGFTVGPGGIPFSGSGNPFTGMSNMQIQSSSVSAAANPTFQLRLLGLQRGPGNSLGNFADWVVKLNNAQLFTNVGI